MPQRDVKKRSPWRLSEEEAAKVLKGRRNQMRKNSFREEKRQIQVFKIGLNG
ncbi:hypothetical protein CE91St46_24200 [Eubacteriales bacterium]|nr:hypothetical protein CE91St46_24200 [Eubacteriales bacterium]GKH64028.1 hypothetical protein CE91St47_24970 [Eubacteriales bacterium]